MTKEDWLIPASSPVAHALVVVGFGNGINPFTLKVEPYVILRDSFNQKPMHTKMATDVFFKQVHSAFVIRRVTIDGAK